MRGGVAASLILAVVVFAAVISVIGSTMRLALHRRRIEVEELRMAATDRFVRGPFVVEGAVQGALGAGVIARPARDPLHGGSRSVRRRARSFLGMTPTFLPWEIVIAMVLGGAALGAGSAFAEFGGCRQCDHAANDCRVLRCRARSERAGARRRAYASG